MDERVTEHLQPYEPEPAYDWDYDDEPRHTPKVLWGRVAILGAGLLVAFLIGRATAPSGISEARFAAAQGEIEDLQGQNEDLQGQITDLQAQIDAGTTDTTTDTTGEDTTTDTTGEDTTTVEGETYKVKAGDTLRGIAQTFCGDAQFDDVIAEANDISDPTQLSVGVQIIIPDGCGA